MVEIAPSRGLVAIVDDEDAEIVSRWRWYAGDRGAELGSYAQRTTERTTIYMHRIIMAAGPSQHVHHRDDDGLNNRRSNLVLCAQRLNIARGRWAPGESGYRGVQRNKRGWRARITINRHIVQLGTFSSALDAAVAYDNAASKFLGEFARLNFSEGARP